MFRSAPRNTEGSEIGVEPIKAEETGPRDRVVRRNANEGARVEHQREEQENTQKKAEGEAEARRFDESEARNVIGGQEVEVGFLGFGLVGE